MPRGGRRSGAGRPPAAPGEGLAKTLQRRRRKAFQSLQAMGFANAKKVICRYGRGIGDNSGRVLKMVLKPTDDQVEPIYRQLKKRPPRQLNLEEAVYALLHLKLSKFQYKELAKLLKNAAGYFILPCYDKVRRKKMDLRPEEAIVVNEVQASVGLNSLVKHTIQRILSIQDEKMQQKLSSLTRNTEASIYISWGFDSSTGQANWHQAFRSENVDDSSVFAININPLLIKTTDGTEIWRNPSPQAALFVRPLSLEFAKETKDFVLQTKRQVERQIRRLLPTTIDINDNVQLAVKPRLFLTMVDGKVVNILTRTTSHQCPFCKAAPAHFKDSLHHMHTNIFRITDPVVLFLSVAPFHGLLKFVWQILKVSYSLPVFEGQIKNRIEAARVRLQRKTEIQAACKKSEVGVLVDMPRTNGYGNTLTGNACRTLLYKSREFSRITGFSKDLIDRFRTILICLNQTKFLVKPVEFQKYCDDTTRLYIQRYKFYPLSPSCHKILTHSVEAQEALKLPIGLLSEGASEAAHKRNKHNRQHHAQKTSREATNRDVFQRGLDMSDPRVAWNHAVISKVFRPPKNKRVLPDEVIDLLQMNDEPPPEVDALGNIIPIERNDMTVQGIPENEGAGPSDRVSANEEDDSQGSENEGFDDDNDIDVVNDVIFNDELDSDYEYVYDSDDEMDID